MEESYEKRRKKTGIGNKKQSLFLQYLFGAAGERKFTDILIFIWAAAVIDVLISIYNAWFYESYMYREYIKIGYRLNLKLFKKAQSADISCYETPEFYNIYTKAASEAVARAMSVLNNCSAAVSALISSVTVIVTMAKITPLALIFIVSLATKAPSKEVIEEFESVKTADV